MLIPSDGTTVSGVQLLDAAASSPVGMASVNFEITGGTLTDQVISGSTPTIYGWLSQWNTTTVPNGTYKLQSVATDTVPNTVTSAPITIIVNNRPPTTSILIPSSGATLSGSTLPRRLRLQCHQRRVLALRWLLWLLRSPSRHGHSHLLRMALQLEHHDGSQRLLRAVV